MKTPSKSLFSDCLSEEVKSWLLAQPDAETAWKSCNYARWLVEIVGGFNHREAIRLACASVRYVLQRVPGEGDESLAAVQAVERWLKGEASCSDLLKMEDLDDSTVAQSNVASVLASAAQILIFAAASAPLADGSYNLHYYSLRCSDVTSFQSKASETGDPRFEALASVAKELLDRPFTISTCVSKTSLAIGEVVSALAWYSASCFRHTSARSYGNAYKRSLPNASRNLSEFIRGETPFPLKNRSL